MCKNINQRKNKIKKEILIETKKDKTRKRIIEASLDEFSENGIAQTGLEKIAERSGLSRRTIYYHFSDKDEILQYIIDGRLSEALADLGSLKNGDVTIQILAEFCLAFWIKEPRLAVLLTRLREENVSGFSKIHSKFVREFSTFFKLPEINSCLRFRDVETNLKLVFFSLFPALNVISKQPEYAEEFTDIFIKTLSK